MSTSVATLLLFLQLVTISAALAHTAANSHTHHPAVSSRRRHLSAVTNLQQTLQHHGQGTQVVRQLQQAQQIHNKAAAEAGQKRGKKHRRRRSFTRVALFEGAYGDEAVANLSTHRTQVVKRWNSFLNELAGQPPDWKDGKQMWGMFEPFVTCPPGMELNRIGEGVGDAGDGGKWVCGITTLKPPCLVYSLGSNGQYDFEDAVLNHTLCHVHTFDCTINGSSRAAGRHFYHNICMGLDRVVNGRTYMSWASVLASLKHKRVDLLKIDIEGFEVPFLQEWSEQTRDYPQQLAIELHYPRRLETILHNMSLGDMSLFISHLYNLGYAMTSKEVNAPYPFCSEFSFIRVEGPAQRNPEA